MSYLERWREYLQRQNDSLQSLLPKDRRLTPFDRRRQILRARALKEAKRLLKEDAVTWDGQGWDIYPIKHHVEKEGDGYVCDCKFFGEWGFCSHSLAVQIKEAE